MGWSLRLRLPLGFDGLRISAAAILATWVAVSFSMSVGVSGGAFTTRLLRCLGFIEVSSLHKSRHSDISVYGRSSIRARGPACILAMVLTTGFFLLLVYGVASIDKLKPFTDAFLRPGNAWTLGPAMLLFSLALIILFFKSRKLAFQRQALHLATVPQNPEFVLNEQSARSVLERLRKLVELWRFTIRTKKRRPRA